MRLRVGHLARLVALPPGELYALAAAPAEELYTKYVTDAGRQLRVPVARLKRIQRRIHRDLLTGIPVHESVHSTKGRSILTNALSHVGHPFVTVLDIRRCYPSIGPTRVSRALERVGFNRDVASLLGRLCTCDHQLPQGAPTSPPLVNLVLLDFDGKASTIARKAGLTYTRYVDDITLSGGERTSRLHNTLKSLLRAHQFKSAFKKEAEWGPNDRKTVTGIVVNTKPNVTREYRRSVTKVLLDHVDGTKPMSERELMSIRGKVVFIKTVNPSASDRLDQLLAACAT